MKPWILPLTLLIAMGAHAQRKPVCPPNISGTACDPVPIPNCQNDGQVGCMWEGDYLLPGGFRPRTVLAYCDDLKPNDPSECILHYGEARDHRKAEADLERIGLQAINDLSACETRMDTAHKMVQEMQKHLQDAKP